MPEIYEVVLFGAEGCHSYGRFRCGQAVKGENEKAGVMRDMLMDGGMMWGMGLFGWLAVFLVVLAIAALIKYVFFK